MDETGVFDIIRGVIVKDLGVKPEKVSMGTRFREDLEVDSLGMAELVMGFEEKFPYIEEISDEDTMKIVTVRDAVDFIHAALAKQATTESPAEYGTSA